MGIPMAAHEIISSPYAAALYLRTLGAPCCRLLLRDEVQPDFAGFPQSETGPEVIVIGDIGERWDYPLMRELFLQVRAGARIVALHKGKYWQEKDGLRLDIGAFIAGLEYATGTIAFVVGNPGDDIELDVGGAQAAGLRGVLVKTGKYRTEPHTASGIVPDAVWESIADLLSV
jgi:ribonucleotide monophosphatase NagD (HAD superfamily)